MRSSLQDAQPVSRAGLVPAALVHAEHAVLAHDARTLRLGLQPSPPEQRLDDWYSCGFGTFYATQLLEQAAQRAPVGAARDVELSERMTRELGATSAEECKAVLAWLHWRSLGEIVDGDLSRMRRDWERASAVLQLALGGPPPARRDPSVRGWVRRRYFADRDRTVLEKAHGHSRGKHAAGRDADHRGASAFVRALAPLAEGAVGERATQGDQDALVRFLLDPRNEPWEDALELLLPRLSSVDAGAPVLPHLASSPSPAPGSAIRLGVIPDVIAELEHRWFASARCWSRVAFNDRPSSPEEMLLDWTSAGYGERKAAQIVWELLDPAVIGAELSEAVAAELASTGIEASKATLAWVRWHASRDRVRNLDRDRMRADWYVACDELGRAIAPRVPLRRDPSVRQWVETRYLRHRDETIDRKAFLRSMAPSRRTPVEDHDGAAAFVRGFAALTSRALAGTGSDEDQKALVRFLLHPDNVAWEDALEGLLPKVTAIRPL